MGMRYEYEVTVTCQTCDEHDTWLTDCEWDENTDLKPFLAKVVEGNTNES